MKKTNMNNTKATNKAKDARTIADVIKYEGIKAKGFGIIPKFITHDLDISTESKAIYGYFSALCGSGSETFPSRATILKHLKLSKDGYYRHYNALIEHGYIRVEKADPSNVKSSNVYIIVALPPKVAKAAKGQPRTITSIDDFGYGILPKAVMMDERLDVKGKGIYCYHASYAGAGNTTFPEKKDILYHLSISEKTYYRYYNQLIQYNYITPAQRHDGRFGVCDYTLNAMPDEEIGSAVRKNSHRIAFLSTAAEGKNQDAIKTTEKSAKSARERKKNNAPDGKNQDSTNQDGTNRDSTNQDTSIISESSTSSSNNSPIARENFSPAPRSIRRIPKKISHGDLSINQISENFENSAKYEESASPDSIDSIKTTDAYLENEAAPRANKAKKIKAYSKTKAVRTASHLNSSGKSTNERKSGGKEKFYAPPPVKDLSIDEAALKALNLKVFSKEEIAEKIALAELLAESPDKHDLIDFIYAALCEILTVPPKSPRMWLCKQSMPFNRVYDAFASLEKKHVEYVMYSCLNNDNIAKARNPKAYVNTSLFTSTITIDNFDSRKFKTMAVKSAESGKSAIVPEGYNAKDFFAKVERESRKLLED